MARRRGDYGRSADNSNTATNILRDINRMSSTGETNAPAGTTDGTAAALTPEQQKKAKRQKQKAFLTPFTDEFVARSGALSAIKGGLTYEQALANLRKLTKATNKIPLEGQGSVSAKTSKALAALTPAQKEAQWAFGILGGYGSDGISQGQMNRETGKYETYQESMFRRLGLDPSTIKNYAPLKTFTKMDPKYGPVERIANPLNTTQRSRLQKLRSLGSLTKKQSAAIARLRAKKNAPTILP